MAAFGNQYGKSPLDASKKNALPPYLDLLFEEYGVGGSDVEVLEFSLTTTGWSGSPLTKTVTKSSTITDGSTAFLVSAGGATYPASGAGIKLTDITINDDGTADFEFSAPAALPETVTVVVVVVTSTSTVAARFKDVLAEINAAKTSAADFAEIATSAATLAEAYASEASVSASAATSAAAYCGNIVSSAVTVLQGQLYPIGATYITSVNATPADILNVGTWELYDKEFVTISLYSATSSNFEINTSYTSAMTLKVGRRDHNISFVIDPLTTNVSLGTTNRKLATINLSTVGASKLAYAMRTVAGADDAGGVALIHLNGENGEITSTDTITEGGGTLPLGSNLRFSLEAPVDYTDMVDSFCNKFYWRRTS